MAFAIYARSPVFDGRDAVVGIRVRRYIDYTYETPAYAQFIADREHRCEGFADDADTFVVDTSTGEPVLKRRTFSDPSGESDIPF